MDVVTTLKEIQARTADLQAAVSKALDEATPWTPREYSVDVVVGEKLVPIEFGVEIVQEGSRFHSIPETGITVLGMENEFRVDTLRIHDEDVPHFLVVHFICDVRTCWNNASDGIPASAFAESVDHHLKIDKTVEKGLKVTMFVKNTSDKPQRLRARIVGYEKK